MITLEEISCYLPYKVKMYSPSVKRYVEQRHLKYTPTNLTKLTTDNLFWVGNEVESRHLKETDYKLVLRQLSDLTREIEHNGKKFVPIEELYKLITGYKIVKFHKHEGEAYVLNVEILPNTFVKQFSTLNFLSLNAFQKLFEWHFWLGDQSRFGFDIIDINTL